LVVSAVEGINQNPMVYTIKSAKMQSYQMLLLAIFLLLKFMVEFKFMHDLLRCPLFSAV